MPPTLSSWSAQASTHREPSRDHCKTEASLISDSVLWGTRLGISPLLLLPHRSHLVMDPKQRRSAPVSTPVAPSRDTSVTRARGERHAALCGTRLGISPF